MKAIVTGSFDPFTLGHLEIVKKALEKYDEVYVVALNNEQKTYMFSENERKAIIEKSTAELDGVIVDAYSGLTADYMNQNVITHIVRGVRNEKDREYELNLATKMQEFNPDFNTELIPCTPSLADVSSTEARKRILEGASLDGILHPNAIEYIKKKVTTKLVID